MNSEWRIDKHRNFTVLNSLFPILNSLTPSAVLHLTDCDTYPRLLQWSIDENCVCVKNEVR